MLNAKRLRKFFLLIFVIITQGLSCSENEENEGQVDSSEPMLEFSSEELFTKPHADGNSFSCNICHARKEPSDDGMSRPGHDLENAYNRSNFKNGQLNTLLEAVNSCRKEWMNAPAFTPDQAAWLSLETFLKDLAVGKGSEIISYQIVSAPNDLTGGDATEGMNRSFHKVAPY
ncbi:MAG: hypothetical protein HRU09_19140 [Oligoflexales bacterium]|nr:hypothetical protein [Oligoflexales bacterium]